jgi:hypothetical protein
MNKRTTDDGYEGRNNDLRTYNRPANNNSGEVQPISNEDVRGSTYSNMLNPSK